MATSARIEAGCGGDNVVGEQMRGNLVRDPVPLLPLCSHVHLPATRETQGKERRTGFRVWGSGERKRREEAIGQGEGEGQGG